MLLRLIGGFCGVSILALAAEGEPRTRAEALEQQQQQKQARLFPQGSDKAEQVYERVVGNPIVKRLLGNKTGFGVQFGTLYPGSGFSLGPDYTAPGLLNENLDLNVAAVGSLKQYYELRAGGSMRHLAQERVRFDFNVRRMDAPQVHYYGPGNNSDSHAKTNYRLEGMFAEGQLSVVPFRRVLQFGIVGGYSFLNVGPGKASDMPSSERVFSPAQAPGIDRQSDYFHVGPFLV